MYSIKGGIDHSICSREEALDFIQVKSPPFAHRRGSGGVPTAMHLIGALYNSTGYNQAWCMKGLHKILCQKLDAHTYQPDFDNIMHFLH